MNDQFNKMPLVSIILAFNNGKNTLPRALKSIFWQIYDNWELILINDGSDIRVEDIDSYLRKDSRIRYFHGRMCRGLPTRLNQGIDLARGRYIARMDVDDLAFPERISIQVNFLNKNPDIDLLGASALMIDDKDIPIGSLIVEPKMANICKTPWHGFLLPHPTWMGRTEWFRMNRYSEKAKKGQDQALLYRTYRNSKFAGIPEVLLGYHYSALSLKKTIIGRYYFILEIFNGGLRWHFALGMLSHMIAAIRDVAAIVTGTEKHILKQRVKPVDRNSFQYWNELIERLKQSYID